jgi:hypothetical protein
MYHNPIMLPSKEGLLERLLQVDEDMHFQMHLYPKILESAGQQKTAMSVVFLLRIAIYDCAGGVPLIEASMLVRMHEFIDALVIDKSVAEEAKGYFEREMAMSSM